MLFYFLYFIFSTFLFLFVYILQFFNKKIKIHLRDEVSSIENVINKIFEIDRSKREILLFHAASAGEYEQIKPILKKISRKKYFIIQSFTSPTIYEKEMNSNLFDICCYHPFDIWWKSYSFFKRIKPDIYCITRHDIWPIHLFMLNFFKIKSIYINVNIHDNSLWVKPYIRKISKIIFKKITFFTVPSNSIKEQLFKISSNFKISMIRDTRFEQVISRSEKNKSNEYLPNYFSSSFNMIFGSYDMNDEKYIFHSIEKIYKYQNKSVKSLNHRIILVPHEVDEKTIARTQKNLTSLGFDYSLYTELKDNSTANIIIVNIVGILPELYKYCSLAYVGSGFSDGVHSVIEPGIYGCAVAYGPNIELLDEAKEIDSKGFGVMIKNKKDMIDFINLYKDKKTIDKLGKNIKKFILKSDKSSIKIIKAIEDLL